MIIKELIEKLKQFPEDLQVMVDGYEADLSEPILRLSCYNIDKGEDGVYGRYQRCVRDSTLMIKVLVVSRGIADD